MINKIDETGNHLSFNDFLDAYGEAYFKIKHILRYLHTYPETLHKLDLELINPDELDTSQQDWIRLVSKFDGLEKDFFKPCWVPAEKTNIGVFIDLSDSNLPVFEEHYFFLEPHHYFKETIFEKVTDLLTAIEKDFDVDEFNEQRKIRSLKHSLEMIEMRNRLKN